MARGLVGATLPAERPHAHTLIGCDASCAPCAPAGAEHAHASFAVRYGRNGYTTGCVALRTPRPGWPRTARWRVRALCARRQPPHASAHATHAQRSLELPGDALAPRTGVAALARAHAAAPRLKRPPGVRCRRCRRLRLQRLRRSLWNHDWTPGCAARSSRWRHAPPWQRRERHSQRRARPGGAAASRRLWRASCVGALAAWWRRRGVGHAACALLVVQAAAAGPNAVAPRRAGHADTDKRRSSASRLCNDCGNRDDAASWLL